MSPERVRYGTHLSQFADVWNPGGAGPAVLVHGGYWRAAYHLDLMDDLAEDLAARGHAVWNLEYRRTDDPDPDVAGGGWPATLEDVLTALRHLGGVFAVEPRSMTAIGHSAGGHLALLAAKRAGLGRIVGLAPVTDLVTTAELGLGQGAAPVLIGGWPDEQPDAYRDASPVHQLPLGCPQLLVHGTADDRVPVGHSEAYVAAAHAAGDEAELRLYEGLDHFFVLDPGHEYWPGVVDWLDG